MWILDERYNEKCDGVDMETGRRDCWVVTCQKNHVWRYYEIHHRPERLSEKTSKEDATV